MEKLNIVKHQGKAVVFTLPHLLHPLPFSGYTPLGLTNKLILSIENLALEKNLYRENHKFYLTYRKYRNIVHTGVIFGFQV